MSATTSGKQQGHELAMEVLKRIAARYENCSVNIYPDMPHLTPVEAVLRCAAEEGFKLVQELPPAHIANLPSEAKPCGLLCVDRDAFCVLAAGHDGPHAAVAQEPEAGLEERVRRSIEGWFSSGQFYGLKQTQIAADIIGDVVSFIRIRDAERDKALEGLAAKWDFDAEWPISDRATPDNRAIMEAARQETKACARELRALIASQKEGPSNPVQPTAPQKFTCANCQAGSHWGVHGAHSEKCECWCSRAAAPEGSTAPDPHMDNNGNYIGPRGKLLQVNQAAGSTRQAHKWIAKPSAGSGIGRCSCGQPLGVHYMTHQAWQAHVAASTRQAPEGGE